MDVDRLFPPCLRQLVTTESFWATQHEATAQLFKQKTFEVGSAAVPAHQYPFRGLHSPKFAGGQSLFCLFSSAPQV